jgi:hypothetical protein
VADVATRFEAKVDRSGEHHVWTGWRLPDGSGQLRVNGKVTTASCAARELARGPLPRGARVVGCAVDPACVRVDHLSLEGGAPPARPQAAASGRREGRDRSARFVRGSGI